MEDVLGWIRITRLDGSVPEWARELNAEADRLDPLTRPNDIYDAPVQTDAVDSEGKPQTIPFGVMIGE